MLTLDRIMAIATEHAMHCSHPGSTAGEHHNIQVLCVAIQEALSENDENRKIQREGIPNGRKPAANAKSLDAYRGS